MLSKAQNVAGTSPLSEQVNKKESVRVAVRVGRASTPTRPRMHPGRRPDRPRGRAGPACAPRQSIAADRAVSAHYPMAADDAHEERELRRGLEISARPAGHDGAPAARLRPARRRTRSTCRPLRELSAGWTEADAGTAAKARRRYGDGVWRAGYADRSLVSLLEVPVARRPRHGGAHSALRRRCLQQAAAAGARWTRTANCASRS